MKNYIQAIACLLMSVAAILLVTSCAHVGPMTECKVLCQGRKVRLYKDETQTCVCQTTNDDIGEE